MNGRRAYLDYNASAPLVPAAREAMVAAFDLVGNASSVHAEGRKVRQCVEAARRQVAALVNGKAEHVVFTSGATESAMTLLTPDWQMGRSPLRMGCLYVCEADHPCLLGGGWFAPENVSRFGVDSSGVADLAGLGHLLDAHDKESGLPLVAVHAVNNEIGVIQPLDEIAALVRKHGGVFVVDAAQAGGRIALDLQTGVADFILLSAHKMGGPKGAGAIVAVSDLMMPVALIRGGGQEKGYRAGTENVAAIAGFGAAVQAALDFMPQMDGVRARRDRLEERIAGICPDAFFYGKDAPRVANTTFFAIPSIKAETAQIAFDLAGVALSAGSACSSGKVGPSHVLKAMGFGESEGALRVSLGPSTTDEDLQVFVDALISIVARRNSAQKAA